MQLSFIYFNFPFWRAEVGKIALFLGDIDFSNKIISPEEFQRIKANGRLDDGTVIPFHQLPCLLVNGQSIAQTAGIARFCGKLSDLYPRHDDLQAAKIDQFLDFATDITETVAWTGKDDSDENRVIKRRELATGELARKLRMLEIIIKEDADWILGESLGLPDITLWRLIGWLTGGSIDGIPTDIIKDYPKIQKICRAVDGHKKIKQWVEETYPKNYVRGNY